MKVGASKVVISPPDELLPFPGLGPGESYGKVYRDIHIRTVAIEAGGKKAVIMVFELASAACTQRIRAYLRETYAIPPAYVSFAATHNHEAVFPTSLLIPGTAQSTDINDRYEEFVYRQAVRSADEALASLREARWAFVKGESYINACRDEELLDGTWVQGRSFTGPSDKTLAVMKFVDSEGKLIAAIMNYGMHGTSCFLKKDEKGETMMVAGDVPGFVSDFIEARYEGAVAAWTIAAGGNQNPIFFTIYHMYHTDGTVGEPFFTGYDGWKLCEHLGMTQGIDVVRLLESVKEQDLRRDMYIKAVDRTVTVPGIKRPGRGKDPAVPVEVEDADPVELRLKVMTLDDVAILSVNGELVAESGLRIKEKLPLKDVMIFSLSEESVGYLPDPEGYRNRTFAFYGTRVKDGCAEAAMTPAYLEMLRERFTAE